MIEETMEFNGYKWARYRDNKIYKRQTRLPSFCTFQELDDFNKGIEKANKKFDLKVKPIMPHLKMIVEGLDSE